MSLPRPIIPAPRGKVEIGPYTDPSPRAFPQSAPLEVDVQNMGNAPRLPPLEGDQRLRARKKYPPGEKRKEPPHKSVKRRDLIPGHEIYLMICQQIGSDPTAQKTIAVDAGEERTAMKLRVNFYSWRQATIREMGADFAQDNHLQDIKVYLDPVIGPDGNIMRHGKSHHPVSNGKVIFYSIRSMREMQALSQALPQLGVTP
jgi:hypothetical protein